VVIHAGYSAAFLALASVAVAGLLLFYFAMPETKAASSPEEREDRAPNVPASVAKSALVVAAE
jgi:predicted MFS family arabinose efflux permease